MLQSWKTFLLCSGANNHFKLINYNTNISAETSHFWRPPATSVIGHLTFLPTKHWIMLFLIRHLASEIQSHMYIANYSVITVIVIKNTIWVAGFIFKHQLHWKCSINTNFMRIMNSALDLVEDAVPSPDSPYISNSHVSCQSNLPKPEKEYHIIFKQSVWCCMVIKQITQDNYVYVNDH